MRAGFLYKKKYWYSILDTKYCLTPLALPHHGRVEAVLDPATQGENIQN